MFRTFPTPRNEAEVNLLWNMIREAAGDTHGANIALDWMEAHATAITDRLLDNQE